MALLFLDHQLAGWLYIFVSSYCLLARARENYYDSRFCTLYSGDIHRVREKKRPQYFRHNFDKFSRSFVIFGMSRPDTSLY